MVSLIGTLPSPQYDLQTAHDVSEARLDILYKVCEYLTRRLAIYINDIILLKARNNKSRVEKKDVHSSVTTPEGWSTLFDAEPLSGIRRINSCLYVVSSSFNEFWRCCLDDQFMYLRTVCTALPGQPPGLLRKHYLFFKNLYFYLNYVADKVQGSPFEQFNEFEELRHFLALLTSTQFLISDLLDLNTTSIGRTRTKLRDWDAALYVSVENTVAQLDTVHKLWRNIRGFVTADWINADASCANGDFAAIRPDQAMLAVRQ